MIIAGHAGVGKSRFAAMYPDAALDLESSSHKYYLDPGSKQWEAGKADPGNEMRSEWPYNYVEAIEEVLALGRYEFVLIPPDIRVLHLLRTREIPYTLAYPSRSCREEYKERYIRRGNTEDFLSIFYDNWDSYIGLLESDEYATHLVLQPGQFLSDAL